MTERNNSTAPEALSTAKSINGINDTITAIANTDASASPWSKRLNIIWATVGGLVLLGVTIYLLSVLSMPVSIFLWTLVIVFCLRGMVDKLSSRGMNRVIATAIAYIVMIIVVAAILFLMFSPMFGIGEQFTNLINGIPDFVQNVRNWFDEISRQYAGVLDDERFKSTLDSVGSSLSDWASSVGSVAANAAVSVGTTIANAFTAIGFAIVIAFWVLLELPALGRETRRVLSAKYAEQAEFFHVTFTRILGGYIKGTILQCLIIGAASGIAYAIIGIPDAPALGVITGVLNIIPIVGPWLGGGVTAITAVFASPIKALIAFISAIVIQQIVYTFISPKIMQNSVDIHPAMTLIAMIFGSAIGGAMSGIVGTIVGMLLSIPAAAVIKSAFIYFFERHTGRQIVGEDGFFFKGKPSPDGVDPLYDATGGSADDEKKVKGAAQRTLQEREDTRKKQQEKTDGSEPDWHSDDPRIQKQNFKQHAQELKQHAKEARQEIKHKAKERREEAKLDARAEKDAQKAGRQRPKLDAKDEKLHAKLEDKQNRLEEKERQD